MHDLDALHSHVQLTSRGRTQLVLENIALLHQLAAYKRSVGRCRPVTGHRFRVQIDDYELGHLAGRSFHTMSEAVDATTGASRVPLARSHVSDGRT
jgi:hypothetical protein